MTQAAIGINGAQDAIKSRKLLTFGDYNGVMQGCMGVMASVRDLCKLPIQEDIVFSATVIDKANIFQRDTRSKPEVVPVGRTVSGPDPY